MRHHKITIEVNISEAEFVELIKKYHKPKPYSLYNLIKGKMFVFKSFQVNEDGGEIRSMHIIK